MSKIVSTKISSIFLAIVLVAGTFAVISPSFIIGVQAQAETEYGYNSYEPEYQTEYTDNNSYEPEYQSYKRDYKPEYPSYGTDNNSYKSKDSVSINKLNCNNINFNGDINGDINTFATSPGRAAAAASEEGDLSTSSFSGNGERYNGYDDGYKKDKDFACIINNNNNNVEDDGNVTTPEPPGGASPEILCEECFKYWLHFLTTQGPATFINEIAENINEVNFGLDEGEACAGTPITPGAECLPLAFGGTGGGNEDDLAQLFEICEQLELALQFLVGQGNTPSGALAQIEAESGFNPSSIAAKVVIGLYDCLEESLLPVLFPSTTN